MFCAYVVSIFLNIKHVPVEKHTGLARTCSYPVSASQPISNLIQGEILKNI